MLKYYAQKQLPTIKPLRTTSALAYKYGVLINTYCVASRLVLYHEDILEIKQ